MSTFRAPLGAQLLGLLLVAGCGHHKSAVSPIASGQGLSAEFVAPAVDVVSFTRFVVSTLAFDWDAHHRLDSAWHYDAAVNAWARLDSSYSQVYVGSPGGPTTEVRHETVADMRVQFLRLGVAQSDLMSADHARLQLRVRQRTYTLGGSYVPPVSYDLATRTTTQFGLTAGSADTLVALGSVIGWWEHAVGLGRQHFDYGGTIGLELDYPDHYIVCPAERLTADIYVFEDGAEVDRFSGSFEADEGEEVYTGALQSERGPWRYAVDESRGCPAPGVTPEPTRLHLTLVPQAR